MFPRPTLYLHSDGILMLLYVDISILYPAATAKAVIEAKVKLSEKYKITNLDQFSMSISRHRDSRAL